MHGADRFIVNTQSYAQDWTVEACLTHLNARGFHHFELTPHPGFLWPGDMDQTGYAHFRRFLAGHRLRIVSIDTVNLGLDIASASAETRAASLDLIERCIDIGRRDRCEGHRHRYRQSGWSSVRDRPKQLRALLYEALDRLYAAAAAVWGGGLGGEQSIGMGTDVWLG